MSTPNKLAILGGSAVIAPGTIKAWPLVDEVDEQYVLASLRGTNHAFGQNCVAVEKEFAAWNGNQYAITNNSGKAALHMCMKGPLRVGPLARCVLRLIPRNGLFLDLTWPSMTMGARSG